MMSPLRRAIARLLRQRAAFEPPAAPPPETAAIATREPISVRESSAREIVRVVPPRDDGTYQICRPVRATLEDGRTADVEVVATYEVGTDEPLRIEYRPLSHFVVKREER